MMTTTTTWVTTTTVSRLLLLTMMICLLIVALTTTTMTTHAFVIQPTSTITTRVQQNHQRQVSQQLLLPLHAKTTTKEDNDENHDSSSFANIVMNVSNVVSKLQNKIIVVKYGGNAMTSNELSKGFCQDVATLTKLGIKMIVVHGGGPQISTMLKKVNVPSKFEGGFRVSSKDVVDVAEMVLCGSVNKQIANGICSAGGNAIGISGRDCNLLQCTKQINNDGYDLGYVGQVQTVNTNLLHNLLNMGLTPVVSPIGTGINDESTIAYNVNADVAAGRIAGELGAEYVLFLTDIAGVLNKEMKLLSSLSIDDINTLIDDETITGGMIPKVSYATSALELGVNGAFITDGRVPHALLKQILQSSDGTTTTGGTLITK